MPLLDIAATAQPSCRNYCFPCRAQTLLHNKFVFGNEKRLTIGWKSFQSPKREDNLKSGGILTRRSVLVISAVATLEPKCLVQSNGVQKGQGNINLGVDSRSTFVNQDPTLTEDTEEVNEREKLRRMRISKANKGNTPWNKGRKHSPETLQRIKERTRLAMQNPKVKMKLVNLGHSQSQETRVKIGAGVRMGWERRREKLLLQETCHFEWQNMIAEASRKGFVGEEELQWDSYQIMNEQLELEWLRSVEERRKAPRPKGSKRAPKSLEQRRKISLAIAAKWADPSYRDRVCSALSKYHGVEVGAEKPRKTQRSERPPRTQGPTKKRTKDTDYSTGKVSQSRTPSTRPKRRNAPLFKDPLASSKLEMIKNIRAERAAADSKKTEAIAQAKLLIAEAEKAAKALEAAALRSPVAQASLNETRKLIAEAIQSIQSIEGQINSPLTQPSIDSTGQVIDDAPGDNGQKVEVPRKVERREINGTKAVEFSNREMGDFGFGKMNLQDLLDGKDEALPTSSVGSFGSLNGSSKEILLTGKSSHGSSELELEGSKQQSSFTEQLSQLQVNGNNGHLKKPENEAALQKSQEEETRSRSTTVKKKWIRGRLVEVAEED